MNIQIQSGNPIDLYVMEEMRRRAMKLNKAICLFAARTNLSLDDIKVVEFKGKHFPQWKGAVAVLPRLQSL